MRFGSCPFVYSGLIIWVFMGAVFRIFTAPFLFVFCFSASFYAPCIYST